MLVNTCYNFLCIVAWTYECKIKVLYIQTIKNIKFITIPFFLHRIALFTNSVNVYYTAVVLIISSTRRINVINCELYLLFTFLPSFPFSSTPSWTGNAFLFRYLKTLSHVQFTSAFYLIMLLFITTLQYTIKDFIKLYQI